MDLLVRTVKQSFDAAARFPSPAELEALCTKGKDFGQEADEL